MATESLKIEEARSGKLRELLFLLSNPLQSLQAFQAKNSSQVAQDFYNANEVSKNQDLSIDTLPYAADVETLKSELHSALQSEIFQPKNSKRSGDDSDTYRAAKSRKTNIVDYPSRLIPPENKAKNEKAGIRSLKSPIEALDEQTNQFLNKHISDLDVISVPENYPTEVHSVSSLAELYLLTQTLPLIKLLPGSHKALMTENFESALLEGKIAVLHSRIEELKRQKKWSLRQPIRYYDPFVYARKNRKAQSLTWDVLIDESKWLSADFKETMKFKKACCFTIAQGIQDYWSYGKVMCIKRAPIKHIEETSIDAEVKAVSNEGTEIVDQIMEDVDAAKPAEIEEEKEAEEEKEESKEEVEGLRAEAEGEDADTIDISKLLERPDPASEIPAKELPAFTKEDLENANLSTVDNTPFKTHVDVASLRKLDQSILRNLPRYSAFDGSENPVVTPKTNENSIMPVSRMLYPMDEEDGWFKIVLKDVDGHELGSSTVAGPPEYQKGLFGVQPHRRFNFLRPPKPPLIRNIEFRSPTIWLPQDDMYLIHYVAEYCFNWDLIAANLASQSSTLKRYESNIERRTPWQCFERYIQLNEKFQFSDMKGINAYPAQQWLEHAHKAQSTTKRRISPLGVGNESIQRGHRKLRWASMFDAMRKTMRKREQALAKINHRRSTNNANEYSVQGANAANGARTNDQIPSPAELSKLKFDRDRAKQETHLNQEATRARMLNAVSQKGGAQQPGMAQKVNQQQRDQAHSAAVAAAAGVPQRRMSHAPSQLQGMQQRGQGMNISGVSAALSRQAVGPAGNPQQLSSQPNAQQASLIGNLKRPTTPNGTPYTKEQIQQLLQMQKQRKMMQQQNQAGSGGVPGAGGTNLSTAQGTSAQGRKAQGYPAQQGGRPVYSAGQNGVGVASGTGVPATSQAAMAQKRAETPTKRLSFAPAQVSAIINSIQQKNPNLTKEQVTKLAASYLANLQQQQQTRLQQQQQQQQTSVQGASRSPTTIQGSSVQSNLGTARQAHLQRQRMAEKEMDAQKLSKLQYEERKKLMMQGQPSPYVQGMSSPSLGASPSTTPTTKGRAQAAPQKNYGKYPGAVGRSSSSKSNGSDDST